MFQARRTRRKDSPDSVDDVVKINEDKVFPALEQIPGFIGAYWFLDRVTGDSEVFTFWKSKEVLESSRPTVIALHNQAFAEIGGDPGEVLGRDHFEVVAKTGDKVHSGATHAGVLEWAVEPSQFVGAISLIEWRVLPALRQDPRLLGSFWLAGRSSGNFVGVALYDSEANLQAAEKRFGTVRSDMVQRELPGATIRPPHHYGIRARALTMTENTR